MLDLNGIGDEDGWMDMHKALSMSLDRVFLRICNRE